MIKEILKYVKYYFNETKQEHSQINDVILKSVLVYQYLYLKHFKKYISVSDIIELNDDGLGLIGPGNGCITWLLERTLGWSDIIHSHSILHDAFDHSLDRGYTYIIPENITPDHIKRNPLCGQIIGLLYCLSKKIII